MVFLLLALPLISSCGGGSNAIPQPVVVPVTLSAADVNSVAQQAAQSVNVPLVIAVVDRLGNVLALLVEPGAPTTAPGNFGQTVDTRDLAISLARTGAFFSNDQAPLSSRTVRFISGVHFPPGVANAANAPLYGIENTNRGCPLDPSLVPGTQVALALSFSGTGLGLGITTGKADTSDSDPTAVNPGGVPLFKSGQLVGGVGVAGVAPDVAEFAAFSAAVGAGFGANPAPPGVVVIDGISLPFVNQTTLPGGIGAGTPIAFSAGIAGTTPPDGDLLPARAGLVGGLTQTDVQTIVNNAVATASVTRAVIRLPPGQRARMAIAVSDLDGTLLALHRMPDSTVFSIDVAVSKARNMAYFSTAAAAADLPGMPPGTAVTNRTISFGAQPFFPPGINGSGDGPFFNLYLNDVAHPCTQGSQSANPNQSGIVFFPGSVPLYKNGVLVGGLGVSGDGVDQDDYVANGGSAGFEAPTSIRADQVIIQGVRMPYLSFPRNPTD
ncbi:MAG: heme-binding protein [Terriglobales bacterium]